MEKTETIINEESLKEVAGGTEDECREIYEFFKTHDPELAALTDQDTTYFRINPYYGVSVMVGMKLGIEGFYYCKDRGDKKNVYIDALDNEYTHAEIMAMLREKYGV